MSYELVSAEANDQIIVTLHEGPDDGLHVRSIDLFVSAMKVRFTANSNSELVDVFQQDIANVLRQICARAQLAKQIINVPDFALRIRGLAIDGYTLLVHTMETGMRQFVVRLKNAFGNALALFRVSDNADSGLSLFRSRLMSEPGQTIDSDRLFDEMLSHIYLPLVNLNNYLGTVLDGRGKPRAEAIASSFVQLKTKAELLQFAFDRLLSEMMIDPMSSPKSMSVEKSPQISR